MPPVEPDMATRLPASNAAFCLSQSLVRIRPPPFVFFHYIINPDFCNIHDGKIPTVKDLSKNFFKNTGLFAKKSVYIGEGAFECRANAILDNFSSK